MIYVVIILIAYVSFAFGIYVEQETTKKKQTKIAFLCDGKQTCGDTLSCGKNNKCSISKCKHTFDIRNARNFKHIGDNKYMEVENNEA